MGFWEGFAKYVGVQGVLATVLFVGYVAAPYAGVTLPEGYTEITTFVGGYFFAKNGVPAIRSVVTRG